MLISYLIMVNKEGRRYCFWGSVDKTIEFLAQMVKENKVLSYQMKSDFPFDGTLASEYAPI